MPPRRHKEPTPTFHRAVPPQYQDQGSLPRRDPIPDPAQHLNTTTAHSNFGIPAIINNLERVAEETLEDNTNSLGLAIEPSNESISRHPPPLHSLSQPASKKRKQALQPAEADLTCSKQSDEELMRFSMMELVAQAAEGSKGAMSASDEAFFLNYHDEQRKMLAIKAIERGVSVAMVDALLGRRVALKGPNSWNQFLKTDEVRAVFRGTAHGVDDNGAMKKISAMWHKLTPEERHAFSKVAHSETLDGASNDKDGEAMPSTITDMFTLKAKNTSLKQAFTNIQTYIDDFIKQATHVARRDNAEILTIAVSKHLGPHSFQIMKSTPGAAGFVDFVTKMDQEKNISARFQSHLTGIAVTELAEMLESKKDGGKKRVKITARMLQLIGHKTQGIKKQWPWTRTDAQLGSIGYKLQLKPGARIDIEWLKRPSRDLHAPEVAMIHLDLDEDLIDLVRCPVTSAVSRRGQSKQNTSSPVESATSSLISSNSAGNNENAATHLAISLQNESTPASSHPSANLPSSTSDNLPSSTSDNLPSSND